MVEPGAVGLAKIQRLHPNKTDTLGYSNRVPAARTSVRPKASGNLCKRSSFPQRRCSHSRPSCLTCKCSTATLIEAPVGASGVSRSVAEYTQAKSVRRYRGHINCPNNRYFSIIGISWWQRWLRKICRSSTHNRYSRAAIPSARST